MKIIIKRPTRHAVRTAGRRIDIGTCNTCNASKNLGEDAKNVQVLTPVDGEYKVASIYGEGQIVVSPLLPDLRLAVDDLF